MCDQPHHLSTAPTQELAARMGEAASNFLASLSADQKAKAILDFGDQARRTFFHYTPIPRDGLPFTLMDRTQQQLAQQLIATGLSPAGFVAASTIMGIETALDAKEAWTRPLPGRDSRLFYVRIFGNPNGVEPWGWSFEGHHISLNYTLAGGRIIAPTPTFFGSNPADSPLSPTTFLRPLAGIEDLARQLIHELDEGQRTTAVLSPVAPPDIATTNLPAVQEGALNIGVADVPAWAAQFNVPEPIVDALRYSSQPRGLPAAQMNSGQRELLLALLGEYIHRMPDELAELELQRLTANGEMAMHFAWAGGLHKGEGHYYRVQGDLFLAEYDNTQNDANHIHSVWRDPRNDFGADILQRHYAESSHH